MCLPSPLPLLYSCLIAVSVMQLPLNNVTQPQYIYVKIVFVLLQPVLFYCVLITMIKRSTTMFILRQWDKVGILLLNTLLCYYLPWSCWKEEEQTHKFTVQTCPIDFDARMKHPQAQRGCVFIYPILQQQQQTNHTLNQALGKRSSVRCI